LSDEPIPMMSFVIPWSNACWIASKCQLWGGWIRAIRRPVVIAILLLNIYRGGDFKHALSSGVFVHQHFPLDCLSHVV